MPKSMETKERLFHERPDIHEIKDFVSERELFGIEKGKAIEIKDIDPKSPSGHWNFLIKQENQKFVFRLLGDEKPIKGDEIEKEFTILSHVAPYKIAPEPLYFSKTEFKEPFLAEEFLEGELFTKLGDEEQMEELPNVAQTLAKISNIPTADKVQGVLQPINSYKNSFKTWEKRLKDIEQSGKYEMWLKQIRAILSQAKLSLETLEPTLKLSPEVFVFKSPHPGHCIKTADGLRFLNWGEAGYGDPSYALAVFLSSFNKKSAKEIMISSYLQDANWKIDESDFKKLLDGRLFERLVSNTIWPIWMAANQRRAINTAEEKVVQERLGQVKQHLR